MTFHELQADDQVIPGQILRPCKLPELLGGLQVALPKKRASKCIMSSDRSSWSENDPFCPAPSFRQERLFSAAGPLPPPHSAVPPTRPKPDMIFRSSGVV